MIGGNQIPGLAVLDTVTGEMGRERNLLFYFVFFLMCRVVFRLCRVFCVVLR